MRETLKELKHKNRWLSDYYMYVWKHSHHIHLRAMEYANVNNPKK